MILITFIPKKMRIPNSKKNADIKNRFPPEREPVKWCRATL